MADSNKIINHIKRSKLQILMSLLQDSQIESSVYLCTFQCTIRQANISMKFPCSYFAQWSTSSGKSVTTTSKHLPEQGVVHFDQKLNLTTEMLYTNTTLQFSKKETIVQLFLISKSRPDQNKLVGRVSLDLSKIINFQMYADPTEFKLNFCSVEGSLLMQFHLIDQKLTTMKVQDLDKSSFIDYISQIAIKHPKNQPLARNSPLRIREKSPVAANRQSVIFKNSAKSQIKIVSPNSLIQNNSYFPSRSEMKETKQSKQEIIAKKLVELQKNHKESQLKHIVNTNLISKINGYRSHTQMNQTQNELQVQISYQKMKTIEDEISQKDKPLDLLKHKMPIKQIKPKLQIQIPNNDFHPWPIVSKNQQSPQYIGSQQTNQQLKEGGISTLNIHSELDDKTKALQLENIQKQLKDRNVNHQFKGISQSFGVKREQLQVTNRQKQDLQLLLSQLQQKQAALIYANESLLAQIQGKDQVIKQYGVQFSEKQNRCKELESVVQTMKKQLSTKTNHRQDTQNNTNYLKQRVKIYETEIHQLNKNLQESQIKEHMYEQKFITLEHMIKNLEDNNAKYHNKLQQELEHKLKLSQFFILKQKQNQQLRQNTEAYKTKFQQSFAESQIKYSHLTQQMNKRLSQKEISLNQMSSQIQSLKLQQVQLNLQKSQLNNEYQLVLNRCIQQEQQCSSLKTKIQQLKYTQTQQLKKVQVQQIIQVIEPQKIQSISNNQMELVEQNNRLNQQIQFLKASLQILQKSTTQEIQQGKKQNSTLLSQLQQLRGQLKEQLRKINNKSQSYPEKRGQQQLKKNQEELKSAKEQISLYAQYLDQQRLKNNQANFENKNIKDQINVLSAKLEACSKENTTLKQQIKLLTQSTHTRSQPNKFEQEERYQQYEMRIAQLNSNLQEQINQNNQLSETIIKYMEKEAKMKQTLTVLEDQSKEIFVLFQQKQHNEQTYQKMIQDLQKQMDRLKTNIYQIHNETVSPNKSIGNSPNSLSMLKEVSPTKTIVNSPDSYNRLKQKLQGQYDQLSNAYTNLQHLNDELNEQLIKLKLKYNELKNESETQIQKLTQQYIEAKNDTNKSNFNSKNIQIDKSLRNKEVEIQILKSKNRQQEQNNSKLEKQVAHMKQQMEFVQQQKFSLESAINQKQIKVLELEQEIFNLFNQLETIKSNNPSASHSPQKTNQEIYSTLLQIKERLTARSQTTDLQSLVQNILDKSLGGQQVSKLINIQEKCRLLSKQLQKLKSQLLKSGYKNQQQKLTYMNLIKPCQSIINELIAAAESLNLNQSSFL